MIKYIVSVFLLVTTLHAQSSLTLIGQETALIEKDDCVTTALGTPEFYEEILVKKNEGQKEGAKKEESTSLRE